MDLKNFHEKIGTYKPYESAQGYVGIKKSCDRKSKTECWALDKKDRTVSRCKGVIVIKSFNPKIFHFLDLGPIHND